MSHTLTGSGWLSMYQLFIAGIAYLNSLWQAADQGWTIVPSYVEALLDVQVCTSVMSSLSGESRLTITSDDSDNTRILDTLHRVRDTIREDHPSVDFSRKLGYDLQESLTGSPSACFDSSAPRSRSSLVGHLRRRRVHATARMASP